MPHPTGWLKDPAAVDAVTIAMNAAAGGSIIAGDQPHLKGFAAAQVARGATGVFPWLYEQQLFGAFKRAFFQRRGTCVGQGTGRAIQDAWYVALAQAGEVGRKVEIALEAIYAGARVQIGGGRINGDGAVGAWAAQFVSRYGVPPRDKYGPYDLSKPNEMLAVEWGVRGRGVPEIVLKAGQKIKVRCYRCMDGDELFDALWAECPVALCGNSTFGDKNADGISRLNQPASHCTELIGAFLMKGGNRGVGGQQSWGPGQPKGPSVLRCKSGEVPLREGMCGVPLDDVARVLHNSGEAWAFQFEHGKGFRP